MSQEWGKRLKKFRLRTGLSQNEFADAISDMVVQFDEETREQLKDINIENMILSNSELSRYETGKRIPRYRSRFVTLILMLVRLGGIEELEEANGWLEQADQSPLTEKESGIIFKDVEKTSGISNRSFSSVLTEKLTEDQPVGLTMPQFAMWSSLLAIVIILLGVIYFLLSGGPVEPDALSVVRIESQKSEPVQASEPEAEQSAAEPTDEPVTEAKPASLSSEEFLIGDFSDGHAGWQAFQSEENMQMFDSMSNELCSDIATSGSYLWALRLWKEEIPLDANSRYRLTMDVNSSVDRNITVLLAHKDLFKWYLFSVQEINVGTQTIEIEFNQHVSDPIASLSLLLGGQAPGEMCFDNLILEEIGTFESAEAAVQANESDNMLDTAPFENGWWETWGFHPFQEPVYTIHFKDQSPCFAIGKHADHLGQINFFQEPISLTAGQEYRIAFDVSASIADEIKTNVIIGDAVNEVWTLSASDQVLEYRFEAKTDITEESFLVHLSGPDESEVCFKNISLSLEG